MKGVRPACYVFTTPANLRHSHNRTGLRMPPHPVRARAASPRAGRVAARHCRRRTSGHVTQVIPAITENSVRRKRPLDIGAMLKGAIPVNKGANHRASHRPPAASMASACDRAPRVSRRSHEGDRRDHRPTSATAGCSANECDKPAHRSLIRTSRSCSAWQLKDGARLQSMRASTTRGGV